MIFFLFSTKGSIEVISVCMEMSNGIPMEIFRLGKYVTALLAD